MGFHSSSRRRCSTIARRSRARSTPTSRRRDRRACRRAAHKAHFVEHSDAFAGGSTGQVLDRSLLGLRALVDRSLSEVRLDAGIDRLELIAVAALVDEIEIGASLQAQGRSITLVVSSVDRTVTIEGDRQIIAAAISNLLQNAFKFTHRLGTVSLTVRATADRVLFEIEDECGGLPPGKSEDLFESFAQQAHDRSGLGLGLSICRRAAQVCAGEVYVRDLPGKGCIFVIELPLSALQAQLPAHKDAPC